MAGKPFDPTTAVAGTTQYGVDPSTLVSGRRMLLRWRIELQRQLMRQGIPRKDPIKVTLQGVIYDGHHAVRMAGEEGIAVDVLIHIAPVEVAGPIMEVLIDEDH